MAKPPATDPRVIVRRSRRDPVWFLREVLGWEPTAAARAAGYTEGITPDQIRIVESVRDYRRTAVKAGHGVGKTRIAAGLVLWFLYTNPGSKVVTTAPGWFQVEHLLWREIRMAHANARFPLGGALLQTQINLDDNWFAVGLSTDEPTRFQGVHAPRIMIIFDEATGVPGMIWDAAEGVAIGEADRLLAIGNPTDPASRFKQVCDNPRWNTLTVSSMDHPNVIHHNPDIIPGAVTEAWVIEHLEEYGGMESPLARARILGRFPDQGSDTLISLAWVEAAQARWSPPTGDVVAAGCDVARFGADETVTQPVYAGGVFGLPETRRGQDTMGTAGALVHLAAPVLAVDDTGVGGGVVDRLTELHVPVVPVNFGALALDPDRFVNRRAEMYWALREALRAGTIALPPGDARLAADLTNVKYGYDSRGRVQLEAKDAIKKRLGRSPDRGDAAALALIAYTGQTTRTTGWLAQIRADLATKDAPRP